MAVATQDRLGLYLASQQHDASPMAMVLALQIALFDAATGELSCEKDLAVCDATSGAITLDLPGADVYVGKIYAVKETSSANSVTVRGLGGVGTIDGGSTYTVPAGKSAMFVATAVSEAGVVTWAVVGDSTPAAAVSHKTVLFTRVNLKGGDAEVYSYQNLSGQPETVAAIGSVITGALATGDATITATIDATPVTGGVVTIAEDGSAAGDADSALPSADNVIPPGGVLELTVGGTNDAAEFADVSVELTY